MDHTQDTAIREREQLPADKWCWQGLAAAEAKRLVRLAGPMIASCLLQNIIKVVSLVFVGHLGELPLANSVASVTGFSIIRGMATALDTLCGQAFGARQHHDLLGVYKQRAMVVLGLTCVPIAVVWALAGRILVLLGQDPRIAAEAGAYARWLVPSLAVSVPLQCHVRFLQAQSLTLPVMASSGAAVICHLAVCWALVFKAGLGAKGAALSNAISWAVNLAMLALVEWWAFEVLVLLSGILPNPQLETSVLSICLNTGILLFMIPSGLGYSVSTRVSNELGAGQPQAAKLATGVVVYIALFSGIVLTLAMTLLRHVWRYMYSNEQEVVAYIARMLPVLGISFFIDGIHESLSGVLRGCGKQKIGAAVNLGAFYLAGIPMAALLAFVFHLNGMGLWLGIVCGSLTKVLLFASVTWSIDWSKEATKAKDRVSGSSVLVA